MATGQEKSVSPPFVSFSALMSFLDQLAEHGSVPTRIDRSLMPKASGSQVSAMFSALRFLKLINDAGQPSELFEKLVHASEQERKPLIADLVKARYDFLFNDAHFHLEKATSAQVAEKFRALEISGTTVTKAVAFFLAAAKEGGIAVSPHVKAPPAPRPSGNGKKASRQKQEPAHEEHGEEHEEEDLGAVERFEIPIPGKASVKVIVPTDLDAEDWEMLQMMITAYIQRWKGFKTKAGD